MIEPQFLLYTGPANEPRVLVRLEDETVWLSQAQMAELFQTTPENITMHLRAVYADGELEQEATCKDYLQVRQEGARAVERSITHYNLDVIISVGYRVRSHRGVQFRQWATKLAGMSTWLKIAACTVKPSFPDRVPNRHSRMPLAGTQSSRHSHTVCQTVIPA